MIPSKGPQTRVPTHTYNMPSLEESSPFSLSLPCIAFGGHIFLYFLVASTARLLQGQTRTPSPTTSATHRHGDLTRDDGVIFAMRFNFLPLPFSSH